MSSSLLFSITNSILKYVIYLINNHWKFFPVLDQLLEYLHPTSFFWVFWHYFNEKYAGQKMVTSISWISYFANTKKWKSINVILDFQKMKLISFLNELSVASVHCSTPV